MFKQTALALVLFSFVFTTTAQAEKPLFSPELDSIQSTKGLTGEALIERLSYATIAIAVQHKKEGATNVALGSGGIVDNVNCLALTVAHTVEKPEITSMVAKYRVPKENNNGYEEYITSAKIVGSIPFGVSELALLKLGHCHNTPWIYWKDATPPKLGEHIYSVGHPNGLEWSFNEGHISSLTESTNVAPAGFPNLIAALPITFGASGSLVVSAHDGRLVGPVFELVPTQNMAEQGKDSALSKPFTYGAVKIRPVAAVLSYFNHLKANGKPPTRPNVDIIKQYSTSETGLLTETVYLRNIGALQLTHPEQIVRVNGLPVESVLSFSENWWVHTGSEVTIETLNPTGAAHTYSHPIE